jgi:hypothetical protein
VNEQNPFDRILDTATKDKSARFILVGMGIVGILLLVVVVLHPFGGGGGIRPSGENGSSVSGAPKVPEGYEALSRSFTRLEKPKDSSGPYNLTVNLLQPASDGRNLGLYTNRDGNWERVATASLVNNGSAVTGQVSDMPSNIAVLRRTTSAALILGALATGAQPDVGGLDVLTTVSTIDYAPGPDGALIGASSSLPETSANVVRVVRATTQAHFDAVNTVLASPALREAHITALVQLALQAGNAGVEIDYPRVNAARRADFTTFVTNLADRLRQSGRTLTLTLPSPVKSGVSWDTGAYDWDELGRQADVIKLMAESDPSTYYRRMEEVLTYLKPRLDLEKVALVVTRQSYEKGSDGLRAMSLTEALTLASTIEVRTAQITPNASVIIVGKNIFQDDGASGLRWDDAAFAVAFSYPGRGGQRTVWIENSLSVAFKLDLARRFGLGGVAIDDISLNPQAPSIWEPLRTYAETGTVRLAQANGVMLRPTWKFQAGQGEPGTKGNVVWRAPAQPGAYDVSLIVSDGVIRAEQKIVLDVAAAPTGGSANPVQPTATPAVRP